MLTDTVDLFAGTPASTHRLIAAEHKARTVRRYHSMRLPGALHCPALAGAQHAKAMKKKPLPFGADIALAQRDYRRRALRSSALHSNQILIYEEALHRIRRAYGIDLMWRQLDFLTDAIEGHMQWCDETTEIRLVPREASADSMPSELTILTFDDTVGEQDFVYFELDFGPHGVHHALYLTSQDALDDAGANLDELATHALDHDGTLALIETIRDSLR
jgi:hypothetical protein